MSVRVSTLDNVCTTFCNHNAVKIAFKRRNITNEREMTLNFGVSTNDRDLRVPRLVSTMEKTCTTFCTQNAVKGASKRRNISIGMVIKLNFIQNRRMIASCEYLV